MVKNVLDVIKIAQKPIWVNRQLRDLVEFWKGDGRSRVLKILRVGQRKAGPAPQTQPPDVGFLGEKKKLCRVSPRPNSLSIPSAMESW